MTTLLKSGDRIRLLSMPDDPDPIPTGEFGTVVSVVSHGTGKSAWHQVDVRVWYTLYVSRKWIDGD